MAISTRQVDEIRNFYGIRPGGIDLACFPLFGLFNAAMGVTTVIPDMDASRPARVDPARIVEAVEDQLVTQSFGSPAIWNRVGVYCIEQGVQLPSLRRVLSAGAPVMPHVLENMLGVIHPDGQIHTPYGATEALPVASISVFREVASASPSKPRQRGGGHLRRATVSRHRVASDSLRRRSDPLDRRSRGTLAGRDRRVDRSRARSHAGIRDPLSRVEPRCRRLPTRAVSGIAWAMSAISTKHEYGSGSACRCTRRVLTTTETMYTIPCEAIFNQHPRIFRSALVGVGEPGRQRPVICCVLASPRARCRELRPPRAIAERRTTTASANAHEHTGTIEDFLFHAYLSSRHSA